MIRSSVAASLQAAYQLRPNLSQVPAYTRRLIEIRRRLWFTSAGHLRIDTQLLYTEQEAIDALCVAKKVSSPDAAREKLNPIFRVPAFPFLVADGVQDAKALKIMQSYSLITLSIQKIKEVLSVCHSPLMYENASGDGGAEDLADTAELSKVLVIVGNDKTSADRQQSSLESLCFDALISLKSSV